MAGLRFYFALWMAKLSKPALKITGHNGTNFPGELALKICPDFLKYVGKPEHIIAVTGTNGKTTVANLIIDALAQDGRKVLDNRAGSNINSGVSTSFINGVSLFNRVKYDTAVLEVDERSSRLIYPYVKPDYIVITNLFRDSIMRNGHPQFIADILTASIPAGTKMILNADDLISSGVAPDNPRAYFGIEKMDTDVTECVNLINDIRICPKCAGKLKYEYRRYHHIGKAYCEDCGFRSPEYDYDASDIDTDAMQMTVTDAGESRRYRLLSDSVFNIYNTLTVIALLREMGMSRDKVADILEHIDIVSSRFNTEQAGNVTVTMQMAKDRNALACSRACDYVSGLPGTKEIFLMMNNLSDEKTWSENTCWLYDCDFEFLNKDNITHIICTGPRGKDYKLRLLLAGIPEDKIDCVTDELEATEKLYLKPGTGVYIFYGTDSLDLAFKVKDKIVSLAKSAGKEAAV